MTIRQARDLPPEERNRKIGSAVGICRNFNGDLNAMREAKLTLENGSRLALDFMRNLRFVLCEGALMVPPYPTLTATAEDEAIAFLITIYAEENESSRPYPEGDES